VPWSNSAAIHRAWIDGELLERSGERRLHDDIALDRERTVGHLEDPSHPLVCPEFL
jgi:hypothetical protein